jgi:hypothetical protein
MIPIKKLSQDDKYIRPEKTITESIQNKKDIEEKLKDFEEISDEDLNFININTLLRYISYDKKNKKELFRFGGLLVKVNKDYIILSGKEGLRFSVQRYTRNDNNDIIHTTRFFKKIKESEILKSQIDEIMDKSTEKITQQNEIIEKQKREIMAMKKKLSKLT